MGMTLPPPPVNSGTGETRECKHVWAFMETLKRHEPQGWQDEKKYIRIDTFYCTKCLKIEDRGRTVISTQPPMWY